LFGTIAQVFSYNLIAKAVGAISALAIIRYMSPSQYADYTMIMAIAAVLSGIIVSLFNRIFIVGYQKIKIYEYKGAFLSTQILSIFFLWLLIFFFFKEEYSVVILSLILAFALCIHEFLRTDYQQALRFNRFSQVLLIKSLILSLSILGLVGFFGSKIQAWHALAAQILAAFAISIPLIIKRKLFHGLFYLNKSVHLSRYVLSGHYRYLIGYSIVLAFFGRLDIFMLRSLSEAHDLSTYGSAFRYYSFLLMALESVKSVYLPVIQNTSSVAGMNTIFKKHQKYVVLSIPVILIGCFVSQWIIPWVDKGRYPDAPTVFLILSISAFMSFAFSPHVTVIMKLEKFLFLFLLMVFCFWLNLGLNFTLIPKYKATGAAFATLISFLCVNSAIFLYSARLRKT